MTDQSVRTHQFENGLMLIVEEMPDVQSAAFSMLIPAGCIYDPPGQRGTASMLADWLTRGAGEQDSRELSSTLDNLGLQRSEHVGARHTSVYGATVADKLTECLRIYGDILLRPALPDDQFEAVRLGSEHSLLSVEDDPQRKTMIELRRRSFTRPWGLPSDGSLEDLPNITPDALRTHFERSFRPNGSILGIAGKVDANEIIQMLGEVLGEWPQKPVIEVTPGETGPKLDFIEQDTAQTHIGISYKSVAFPDPDYYNAWAAASVLSGGMSARLFTEVREKRGLCYSISASQASMKHEGRVICYAGTSNERAQETLDVALQELKRLGEGIEQSELDRCKARAKSSLIMQQESSRGRASSLARNWFLLGEIRTLEEVRDKIDALTTESILEYVHRMPAEDFTVVTIGPKALEVNS
ncbi:MAG: insulinase family protein [Planctomycetes bacterium]|nr:insulinase family protein [Planctomycetota bacterium]